MSVMPSMAIDQANPHGRTGGRASRPASRPEDDADRKLKKGSWRVSSRALKQLAIHAAMEDRSQSAIVDELLLGLNRYQMPRRNSRSSKEAAPATPPTSEPLPVGEIGSEAAA